MIRLNVLTALLFLATALLLAACGGPGGGYDTRPWENGSVPETRAQQEPSPLDVPGPPAQGMPEGPLASVKTADAAPPETDLPPVRIALLLPLSGPNAALGKAMLQAAQMALFDIAHRNFEIISEDTQGTAAGGSAAARNAVNQGAKLILGPVFAEAVRAAKPAARQAGVNMISFSTDWTLADDHTFIMGFLPFDQVERIAQYAASQRLQTIGVLAPSSVYGDAALASFRSYAPRYGLRITESVRFSAANTNISPVVRNFTHYDRRSRPGYAGMPPPLPYDAVFLPAGGDLARTVASLAAEYGVNNRNVKFLGTGLWDDKSLTGETHLNGAWFAAPSPNSRRFFEKRFAELYGYSPPRLSTLAYDATALAAVLAHKDIQAGSMPSFSRASIINPNGFSGIDGIFRFRSDSIVERGLAVLELRRGRIVVIDEAPRTFQQQTPQQPF